MVGSTARYDSLILLPRVRAFHFNGPPPKDICSVKYLQSNNFDEVISAVLANAQRGDFSHFSRLVDVMQKTDDGVVWGRCCELFAHAAPFSALHDLIDAYSELLFKSDDIVTQQWICELLCLSGALWSIPEVLKIFRMNKQRDQYYSVPRYLSFLLEADRKEISEGPPIVPRTDTLPEWFDVPIVYDDDTFERIVLERYEILCSQTIDINRTAIWEGELLSMKQIAKNAHIRINMGQDIEEIAIARALLEATTGEDLSAFYKDALLRPLSASACVETLFETCILDTFEPGTRYFFGRKIPD